MQKAGVLCVVLLVAAVTVRAAGPIQIIEVTWRDAPATMPAGTKMAVLEGDPKKEGLFTIRLKLPAGAKVMPHTHPRPERVTVLWGEARVGFGNRFDAKNTKRFPAGSYYVNPPDSRHYLFFPRATVLQLTGDGPWELHYLEK